MPWKTIGHVPVDAGLVVVMDPCYLAEDGTNYNPWTEIMDNNYQLDDGESMATGLAVVVHTAHGDGVYPVEALFNEHDRISEIRVRFE